MGSPTNSQITTNSEDDEHSRQKWRRETPSPTTSTSRTLHSNSILLDAGSTNRKSAFLPYRPHTTVLTNLQRGNTEATFCPIEVSLSFHERCGQGEITKDQVKAELERQNTSAGINFKDVHGFIPLHWAAYYGQQAAAQMLIDAGANVNAEAAELVTPLLLAAANGHNEIVRLLLECGANAGHMDIEGNTALMYAAAGNHPHTCNELLSKDLDLTATNEHGESAYLLAVEHNATLAQAVLEQYLCAIVCLGIT